MSRRVSGDVVVTKEFTFDFAHMLAEHEGLCRNVHGHTYKLQVSVTNCGVNINDKTQVPAASVGMVIDFKALKEFVTREIAGPYDHAFVTWTDSPDPVEHEIARVLKENGRKIVEVNYRPTAENFAQDWFDRLAFFGTDYNIDVVAVKVWETPTSYATVRRDI